VVVEPTRGLVPLNTRELWRFRELLYFLTLREIKVRYKQTALGVAWALLQPVLAMLLFTFVFGHVAKLPTDGVPYPIFAYSALVPWFFFATAVQISSTSLTVNPDLVTKVYFPRLFLVLAPVLAGVVDFLLASLVLAGMVIYYGVSPEAVGTLLAVPLFVLALMTTVGVGALLASLNVKYRDVRFVVPFLVQVWFFATPIVYSLTSLGQPWRSVYGINPMATVVLGFRWAFAGGPAPDPVMAALSVAVGAFLFAAGLVYFQRTEKSFADVI
jgi:lipopolysaccharide transport system permease protein